ncbi:1,3-beta-glucan synthase component-domain-containing protein, partial [Phycomyces blakesleeanus]
MDLSQTTFGENDLPVNFLETSDLYTHGHPFSDLLRPPKNSPDAPATIYQYWDTAGCPIRMTDIEDIFLDFAKYFGFQRDNRRNMYDHLLTMLDSRSARMTPRQALLSLHADYIGGEHANYRKWYFASQLDLDDRHSVPTTPTGQLIEEAKREWRQRMESLTDHTRVCHLALYLLIWGEAATLRYMPELICFLFKAADDYRVVINTSLVNRLRQVAPESFLDTIITPIYQFARGQSYTLVRGECIRRERDHNHIIGYDDINQLFWDRRSMARLRLRDGQFLKDIVRYEQFHVLSQIEWSSTFEKTFYETRSSLHLLTNFSRIWIIHAASFWYYMAANVDFVYLSMSGNRHDLAVKLSVIGLGGLVASLLLIMATLAEFAYLPATVQTTKILVSRILVLMVLSACHVGASVYVIQFNKVGGMVGLIVASCQLGLGAILSIVLAIVPSANLFRRQRSSHPIASKTFTAHFPGIPGDDRCLSILLWICIFSSKFLETYFFLALSFRDALGATISVRLGSCAKDTLLGNSVCRIMPILTSTLLFSVEFLLFFLDTYLWYVVWSTLFSVSQSMHQGLSVMTSWRTLFGRLPQQIIQKVVATKELDTLHLRKIACSQMWNAIVISMYREHLLSISNLQALLYQVQTTPNANDGTNNSINNTNGKEARELKVPEFFDPKGATDKEQCFPGQSEAERRLSFFAQSLSTDIPKPCSVHEMPVFTVFTPHYAEKMLLSLREIIREEDTTSRVTLLEYLKKLHPAEWENFVKDTKLIVEESENETSDRDDLPFYCIGFKSSAPEYTLRTRLWASQRAQTLYRTVCGFMNYARALKLLYRIEHPEIHATRKQQQEQQKTLLDQLAHQKFRFLVAMQRYAKFNSEEAENCEYLLNTYPHLQIAYIDEEKPKEKDQEPIYYSVLIDGNCERLPGNKRLPRYRVRLPGNPILGDGKSDNQNHALIFYRGEYLQLVDANQDNYLEECIKIRSIFREFEQ